MSKKANEQKVAIVYRKIEDLLPADYNPRKITEDDLAEVRKSIEKYGFVVPIVINMHEDRKGTIVGGHQRIAVAQALGYTEVPTTEVHLATLNEEQELNIRLNKNHGEFDNEMLKEYFNVEDLASWGFQAFELEMFGGDDEEIEKEILPDPVYPMVPKFNEKYDCLMIFIKNELDYVYIKNLFAIERRKSYKNKKIGECMVLTVDDVKNAFDAMNVSPDVEEV